MCSPLILEITSNFPANIKKDIDTLISLLDYNSIWQTIEWQVMLYETRYVYKSFFVGIYKEKKLLSFAIIEKRSIGLGNYGFFCIGGPVGENKESLQILSETLKEISTKEKVIFIQIEPLSSIVLADFKISFYKNFIEKYTAVIDLKQDNETILAHMKPKGRYNIRVAEKAGVEVEQVPLTQEYLDIFYSILSETLERDQFSANSQEYFRIFLQYLEKQNLGGLFIAKREDRVIATGIFVFYKKTALYYYGASSSDNTQRKYMASYLLQWKAIEEAKKRGCEIFDFLGIADPNDPHSSLVGVTDFKLKLTDNIREWQKTQILVLRKGLYLILQGKQIIKMIKNRFFK
ncbi:MAG: peptidoglycan bridge formation glycyltransferase FemA/FemB family protein [Candidatus Gracilibacteria bacterium]|nr:peptidoglycan bridge formation glycyltransferase FemA/FemB family protein [Candidatus Gracilibacteria bacterium]